MAINTQYPFIISNKTVNDRLYQKETVSTSLKWTKWYYSLRVVGNMFLKRSVWASRHGICSYCCSYDHIVII